MTEKEKLLEQENESLSDQAFDFFGAMLLEYEGDAKEAEIAADYASGNTTAYEEFSARNRERNLKAIDAYMRKEKWRGYRKPLMKIAQVAAVAVLTLTLAGVAIAASHTLRIRVMELLATREDKYTELRLQEDVDASFEIPTGWEGESYPSYIPDGMEMRDMSSFPGNSFVEYGDSIDPEKKAVYSEYAEGVVAKVDTEGADVEAILVQGYHPAVLFKKDQQIGIYWNDGRNYYVLISENLDVPTMRSIAESVVRVN